MFIAALLYLLTVAYKQNRARVDPARCRRGFRGIRVDRSDVVS